MKDIEKLLTVFSKTEIATGRYNLKRVEEFGMAQWTKIELRIAKWRKHPAFELLLTHWVTRGGRYKV